MTPSDYETLLTLARTYPVQEWQADIVQDAAERVLRGTDVQSAFAAARRHADTLRRYERGAVSLEALADQFADALHVFPSPTPTISPSAIRTARHQAGGKATPRVEPRSIDEIHAEDESTFRSVIRNLVQRGVLTDSPDLAVDVACLPERLRQIVRDILCSATKEELGERGYKKGEIYRATRWLTTYHAPMN